MKIKVVICTHNNEKIIGRCLKSVFKLKLKPSWKLDVLVVDDASIDGTVDKLKKWKNVNIERMQHNRGPARCKNMGFYEKKGYYYPSPADYFLFLDSDVVLSQDCLVELMKGMKKGVGITCPKLLLPNGKINSAGGGLAKSGFGFDIGYGSPADHFDYYDMDVMYACSAVMLVKQETLVEVGEFDSDYFYGHEDTDYGWRANLMGFKVRYIHSATAVHYKSSTVGKNRGMIYYHATKNRLMSILKNYEFSNMIVYGSLYFIISIGDIIFRPYKKEKIRAWLWSIWHLGSTLSKRWKIQNTRVLTDDELPFSWVLP